VRPKSREPKENADEEGMRPEGGLGHADVAAAGEAGGCVVVKRRKRKRLFSKPERPRKRRTQESAFLGVSLSSTHTPPHTPTHTPPAPLPAVNAAETVLPDKGDLVEGAESAGGVLSAWSVAALDQRGVSRAESPCSGPCSSRSSACEAGAREVIQEPVWKSAFDAQSGRTYYYEVKTREVAWELPAGGAPVASRSSQGPEAAGEVDAAVAPVAPVSAFSSPRTPGGTEGASLDQAAAGAKAEGQEEDDGGKNLAGTPPLVSGSCTAIYIAAEAVACEQYCRDVAAASNMHAGHMGGVTTGRRGATEL
jgi:hypothetical protein